LKRPQSGAFVTTGSAARFDNPESRDRFGIPSVSMGVVCAVSGSSATVRRRSGSGIASKTAVDPPLEKC
jgi:hypothetical protein